MRVIKTKAQPKPPKTLKPATSLPTAPSLKSTIKIRKMSHPPRMGQYKHLTTNQVKSLKGFSPKHKNSLRKQMSATSKSIQQLAEDIFKLIECPTEGPCVQIRNSGGSEEGEAVIFEKSKKIFYKGWYKGKRIGTPKDDGVNGLVEEFIDMSGDESSESSFDILEDEEALYFR